MRLLNYTYFTCYPTYIAGIDAMSGHEPTMSAKRIIEEVTRYIENLEPKFMCQILGEEMAESAVMDSDIAAELAPIAAKYVYFFYERDHATANTLAGEKVKTTDQSRIASSQFRLVRLWNDMVRECHVFAKGHCGKGISPDLRADIFDYINAFNL